MASELLPDAIQASPDTLVIPHPSLMSRSGGRGGRTGGGGLPSLRAPAHYPSPYLTSLAPPPALSPASLLLPRALLASLLKKGGGGKKEAKDESSSSMQLSVSETFGALLGTALALSAAALAATLAAASEVLPSLPLLSSRRRRSSTRLVPRAEALAGAQLLALAALAPPPHLASQLVGVARSVLSGSKDFAAADSAAAADNALMHLLIFSAPASEDDTSWGVFPLRSGFFSLPRLALLALQLWSLVALWLPLALVSPGAARGAAAAIDASVASAAGAAAARAEEVGGPLSRWRDGHVDCPPGGGGKTPSKVPKLAGEYWRPPAGAGTRTVLLSARADAVARCMVGMTSRPDKPNPVLARSRGPWATSPADAPGGGGRRGFGGSVLRGARGAAAVAAAPAPLAVAASAPSSSFPNSFVSAVATITTTAAKGSMRPVASSSPREAAAGTAAAASTAVAFPSSPPQSQRATASRSSSPRAVAALMDALWSTVA